eukprot:gene17059-18777_t
MISGTLAEMELPDAFCIGKFVSSVSVSKDAIRACNRTSAANGNSNTTDLFMLNDELTTTTKALLGTLYVAAFLLGTFGNLLTISTVLLNKRMQTTGNMLLLNLSISDLIVTMICMPVVFGYQVLSYPNWPHGKATCKAYKYLVQLSAFCSLLTLLSISIHRYFVLHGPLKARLTCVKKKHIFIAYWLCALLFTIPAGIATQLVYVSSNTTRRSTFKRLCIEVYDSRDDELLYMSLRVSAYFLTVLTLTVLHSWIIVKLWRNKQAQLQRLAQIKTVVRLLIAATIAFSVCWLPYAVHIILSLSRPRGYVLIRDFDIFGNFLGLANSVLDPLIYCCFSKSFRTGFKDTLRLVGTLLACKSQHRVCPEVRA